jgi:hypothetical protein
MTTTTSDTTSAGAAAPGPVGISLRGRHLRFRVVWAVSSLLFLALSCCWIVANPIGAGPDEPVHMVKAAATVRGQLVGSPIPNISTAMRRFTVPEAYARATGMPHCFQFNPDQRATCEPAWSGGSTSTQVYSYVARYPPWYYLVVGLPTLVTSSRAGPYAMRFMSALICALLVGLSLALAACYGRSRLLVTGIVVAMTPQLVFLSSIVNPSSMEMAAGLCAWVAAIVIVLDHADSPPVSAIVALVVSGSALALSRSISPMWTGIVIGTMFLLDTRRFIGWVRNPGPMRRGLAALLAVCGLATLVDLAMKSFSVYPAGRPLPPHASQFTIVRLAFDRTNSYYHQFIGVFGWLDTKVPPITYWTWTVMLIAVVVIGLVSGTWRQRACMLLIGAAIIVIPTAITSSHARVDGLVWQARYSYPLDVGLLVLAVAAATRAPFSRVPVARVLATLAAFGWLVGQWAAFYQNLRRYVVGAHGPARFFHFQNGFWQPPLSPFHLVLGATVAVALLTAWFLLISGRGSDSSPPPRSETLTTGAAAVGGPG